MGLRRYNKGSPIITIGGNAHMLPPSVSVVVPALNEARNIPHVFSRIPADVYEVVLVDGFSVDDTVAIARQARPDVRVVAQTRQGKGNALACGFAAATGDIIAMVDADGSADPGEIPRFVAALLDGADFAKGTRFAEGGGSNDITRLRSLGNYALTAFFNAAMAETTQISAMGLMSSGGGICRFWAWTLRLLSLTVTVGSGATASRSRRSSTFASPRRA